METRHTHRRAHDSGLTLVEMLIVVVVLGVLAAVVVIAVSNMIGSGEQASVDNDGRAMVTAQEAYFVEHGAYATEAELVSSGLLREESLLHDVALNDDGTYTLIALRGAEASGSGGSDGSGGSGSSGDSDGGSDGSGTGDINGQIVDADDGIATIQQSMS